MTKPMTTEELKDTMRAFATQNYPEWNGVEILVCKGYLGEEVLDSLAVFPSSSQDSFLQSVSFPIQPAEIPHEPPMEKHA
jgi:hypothetical protein